jgi:hypothetical protein
MLLIHCSGEDELLFCTRATAERWDGRQLNRSRPAGPELEKFCLLRTLMSEENPGPDRQATHATQGAILIHTLTQLFTVTSVLRQLYNSSARHCDSCTLGQLYTGTAVHCDSCTLWQLYTVAAVHCDSCTIRQLDTVTAILCDRCILWQLCTVITVHWDSCTLWQLYTVTDVHYDSCTLW